MYYVKSINVTEADERAFRRRVTISENGCHMWTGYISRYGYGQISVKEGRTVKAHNLAWQIAYGDPPEGLFPDHLCRNKACVNPEHIDWVTAAENARRERATRPASTHCRSGLHRWDDYPPSVGINTDGSTRRRCRPCRNAAIAARKARLKQI